MWTFILKRLFHLIPILLGVSLLTFLLMSITPGDYFTKLQQNPQITPERLAELRASWKLDKPWYVRYAFWVKNAVQGDFGDSISYHIPAMNLIADRLVNTLVLAAAATAFAWLIAIPLGIFAAVHKDSLADRLCSLLAFVGLSIPEVLLALLALMFAYATEWFPIGGVQSALFDTMGPMEKFADRLHHLVLPTVVLGVSELAGIMRQMRSNLIETLRAEYVTAALARGVSERTAVYKHALRNAINPLITIFGYSIAGLLSGAFIVENIMAWPGLGQLTMEALSAKDVYLVVDNVVMAATVLVFGNFVADILLAWSDPRIRLQ